MPALSGLPGSVVIQLEPAQVAPAEREILFKVTAGGHEYTIYTNGEVDGFGDDTFIVNYYQPLVQRAIAAYLERHPQAVRMIQAANKS